MAGKTGKKIAPKAADAKDERSFFVRLELDGADHKRLRVRAASEGVPMSVFARRVVIEALDAGGQES